MTRLSPPPPSDAWPESATSDEDLLARVKHAVLARIAKASAARLLTVPSSADDWQPFLEGIQLKVLHETEGTMSYLLRLAPGAVLPAHRHPVDEECLVLEGSVRIGHEVLVESGGYHLAPGGRPHGQITSEGGALLFLRGAVPDAADLI